MTNHESIEIVDENPTELSFSDNVLVLKKGDKTFYIIGTAHISHKSVEEVEWVIDQVQPDTVCVELCNTRFQAIRDENVWKNLNIFEVIKQGKFLFLLAHLMLSSYQKRMAEKFGIQPGAELIAAVNKAEEIGANLVLADRDVQITLKRTWGNLSVWDKAKLFFGITAGMFSEEEITEEELEKLKERNNLSDMLKEFAKAAPAIKGPLIDERDLYLISSIEEAPGNKIVAVVGAGHVEGMEKNFGKEVNRDDLNQLPPKNPWIFFFKWGIPLLVVLAFVVGYNQNADKMQTVQDMLLKWILPNAIACAVLTALAGGKLLSILVGAIASPITSLNPTIGAGMVVGFVEAWLRKPTVADCERIREEVKDFKGIYKNPFTRVLLVAVMANFGSALGAWVALPLLLKYFF